MTEVGLSRVDSQNPFLSPQDIVAACDASTRVVSCMALNNETGQILPLGAVTAAVKSRWPNLLVHTDAVQAFGKAPFSPYRSHDSVARWPSVGEIWTKKRRRYRDIASIFRSKIACNWPPQ